MNTQNVLDLRREIEIRKEKLNELVIYEDKKNVILKYSMELDELINKYYRYLINEDIIAN